MVHIVPTRLQSVKRCSNSVTLLSVGLNTDSLRADDLSHLLLASYLLHSGTTSVRRGLFPIVLDYQQYSAKVKEYNQTAHLFAWPRKVLCGMGKREQSSKTEHYYGLTD